jgi:predicted MFS family arabinose efflux permease
MLRPALAGAAATLSGIGLARFAYVPLFPAMVAAGWVTGAEAGFLGAVNLAGYLGGVLGGRSLARRLGTPSALDVGMAITALSFAACAWDGGPLWLALWRCAAGAAGGVLMALVGPAVQGAIGPAHRGVAGGIVMTGVGVGIILASLAVPLLLRAGLPAAWLGFGAIVTALWVEARPAWPKTPVPAVSGSPPPGAGPLCLAYGVSGAGFIPHMVYFSDLVVRGRGLPTEHGAAGWLLFGLGGLLGPLIAGRVADRVGALPAIRAWIGLQIGALALALSAPPVALAGSAFLGGFSAVGMTAITLARARELAGADVGIVWVRATVAFAIAQAGTGFLFAALFAWTGSHDALFALGSALAVAALVPILPARPGRGGA